MVKLLDQNQYINQGFDLRQVFLRFRKAFTVRTGDRKNNLSGDSTHQLPKKNLCFIFYANSCVNTCFFQLYIHAYGKYFYAKTVN